MTQEEIKLEIESKYVKELNTFVKIAKIIYDIGSKFNAYDPGQLSEKQMTLAGYKFYLSDFVSELYRMKEYYSIKTKEYESGNWDKVKSEMESEGIQIKNKEQVKNKLYLGNVEDLIRESEYGSLFLKYKIKLGAIDDVLTSIAQRIKIVQQGALYN